MEGLRRGGRSRTEDLISLCPVCWLADQMREKLEGLGTILVRVRMSLG